MSENQQQATQFAERLRWIHQNCKVWVETIAVAPDGESRVVRLPSLLDVERGQSARVLARRGNVVAMIEGGVFGTPDWKLFIDEAFERLVQA